MPQPNTTRTPRSCAWQSISMFIGPTSATVVITSQGRLRQSDSESGGALSSFGVPGELNMKTSRAGFVVSGAHRLALAQEHDALPLIVRRGWSSTSSRKRRGSTGGAILPQAGHTSLRRSSV
jgi:hypothetical protein